MAADNNPPQYGERITQNADNFCYRHKDRQSFVLCQRCGRTVCGDCQVQSAVGVLCPECMREAQPSTTKKIGRSARVSVRRLAGTDAPVVTYGIMLVSAVVFVGQLVTAYFADNQVTQWLQYAPVYALPEYYQPWRLLTAMFTHSTGFLLHILFNMYALWLFGPNLERMIGRWWFLLLYIFSGIGGSLATMLWVYVAPDAYSAMTTATVGASGAIFGILMATLVAYKAHRVNVTSLAVLIGINFAIGLMPGVSISWQAHLGGMVVGGLTMWALLATRGPRKRRTRVGAVVGIGAALAMASLMFFFVPPVFV